VVAVSLESLPKTSSDVVIVEVIYV
jgi:hypothetical protein